VEGDNLSFMQRKLEGKQVYTEGGKELVLTKENRRRKIRLFSRRIVCLRLREDLTKGKRVTERVEKDSYISREGGKGDTPSGQGEGRLFLLGKGTKSEYS